MDKASGALPKKLRTRKLIFMTGQKISNVKSAQRKMKFTFQFSDEKYSIFIPTRSFIHIPFTQVQFQITQCIPKNTFNAI